MKSRWLWIILAVALAVRVALLAAVWHEPQQLLTPDSGGYLALARHLVTEGSFAAGDEPEIFRTPGYPLMLAAALLVGGEEHQIQIAAGVQILLDVLLVYLTFLLGLRLGGRRAGIIAAALQAVACVAVASSVRMLSDAPFAVMLTAAVLLLIRHFDTGRWRPLLQAAVLAGAACYVRPLGLVFVAIAAAVLLCRAKRLRRTAAFAAVAVAIVLPWIARNASRADYIGFSSFASDSMYQFSASMTLSEAEGIPLQEAENVLSQRLQGDPSACRCAEWTDEYVRGRARIARETIAAHPLIYARIHLVGCGAFWLPGVNDVLEVLGVTTGQRGTLRVLHTQGLIAAARHYLGDSALAYWTVIPAAAVLAVKYMLVLIAAAAKLRWRMGAAGWLVVLTVLALAFVGGPCATPRFRVPAEPMLSVAAALGAACLAARLSRRSTSSAFAQPS